MESIGELPSWGEPAAEALLGQADRAYRRLRWSLSWPLWRRSLRQQGELLLATARLDERVERLLDQARRRALGSTDSPLWESALRLNGRREALGRLARMRLGPGAPTSLRAALLELEEAAWRRVSARRLGSSSWALAEALLPPDLPEVAQAAQGAQILQSCVLRPPAREGGFPWAAHEVQRVAQALPATEAALRVLWMRVSSLESSGRLERSLRRLAKKSPRGRVTSGAQVLVHATFWCQTARSRLRLGVRAALPTLEQQALELHDEEVLPVVQWLTLRALGSGEPLQAVPGLTESRAALLEFAAAWTALERDPGHSDGWGALQAQASRLDRVGSRVAREAGREPLRRFVRYRGRGLASLPHEASLVGWVRTAWALSSAPL